ncbi:Pr6Pr family membrane protein [Weissella diestrammenae]|uniref:Pr6Pr family membrane protein n=1 Tax=Weissella diestrammenae TaxID=1162633 RepID=A0A7G9T5A7_9LACO|nr:Pr6Pr family membrane protein [Weissella diestrammenae]MCM0583140.1 Pr6Pr family membrane protein [Weissella diestrammenae]QNN75282.1 Pr6Pr family membrane protein [Weissella diestrammenae]
MQYYRKFMLLFRILIVISSGVGVAYEIGIFKGIFNWDALLYYTVLSNAIIFGEFVYLVIKNIKSQNKIYNLRENQMGAFMLMIMITGLIFNILLAGRIEANTYAPDIIANFLVHTLTPLLVFIDWLIFVAHQAKYQLKPITWTEIPLIYLAFIIVYAEGTHRNIPGTNSPYPYFFINIQKYGLKQVALNVLVIFIVFLFMGYLLKWLKIGQTKFMQNRQN